MYIYIHVDMYVYVYGTSTSLSLSLNLYLFLTSSPWHLQIGWQNKPIPSSGSPQVLQRIHWSTDSVT